MVPLGITLEGHSAQAGAARPSVHDRLFRPYCSREGPAPAGGRVSTAADAAGRAADATRRRRIPARRTPRVSGVGRAAAGRTRVWRPSSDMRAPSIAPARSRSFRRWTSCRCRRRTPSRRDSRCSRPWRTACPSSSRATARFPKSSRAPAAACSSSRTIADALADGLFSLVTDRDLAARLGSAGAEGVRRHYGTEAMASGAETVYRDLVVSC